MPRPSLRRSTSCHRGRSVAAAVSAAAAAATTAATAATATAAAAATATAAATGPGLARPGLIDRQATAVDLLVVQGVDRGLRLGVRAHFDETESLASTRVPVGDHLRALTLPYWENSCSRSELFMR